MASYNGSVQGLCIHGAASVTGFCAKVEGGSLGIDEGAIINDGLGNVRIVRGGTIETALQWQCVGVPPASSQLWFPTAVGVQVASFPAASSGFLVECDDGTAGQEFVLDACQPAGATIAVTQARDAQVVYDFSVMSATPSLVAIGTHTPAYLSLLGHTINDVRVTVGAADAGVLSFSLTNGMALAESNPMNTAGTPKRAPGGYYRTAYAPSISIDTEDQCATWLANMLGDDLPAAADIVIAMTNGTVGQNVTATLHNFQPTSWGMDLAPTGLVGFRHTFVPGTGTRVNRVTFA